MVIRFKIISIIKEYMEKWSNEDQQEVFANISEILKISEDTFIQQIMQDNTQYDAELENDIDLANYVVKNEVIRLEYDQIDDDLEAELQYLYDMTK